MRRVIVVMSLLICLSSTILAQNKSNDFQEFRTLDSAIAVSKSQHKKIIIDFFADWCLPCKRMDAEVLSHEKLKSSFAKDFILLKLNAEKEGKELARRFSIGAFPSYVVTDANLTEAGRVVGAMSLNEFIDAIFRTVDSERTVMNTEKRFNQGERTPQLVNDYVYQLMKEGKEAEGFKIIDEYFSALSETEKASFSNWFVFNRYTVDRNHTRVAYLLKNQETFRKTIGDSLVNFFFQKMIRKDLVAYATESAYFHLFTNKDSLYNSIESFIKEAKIEDDEEVKPLFNIVLLRRSNLSELAFLSALEKELPNLKPMQQYFQISKFKPNLGSDSLAINRKQIELLEKFLPNQNEFYQRRLTNTLNILKNAGRKDGVKFDNLQLSEAFQKAKKENKKIFVDFYAIWCGPCKRMDMEVFPLGMVGDVFKNNLVAIKVDGESAIGKELVKKYKVDAYPTYLLLDTAGKEMKRLVGYVDAERMVRELSL